MESCSGAHQICRRLLQLGSEVRILPAQQVGAYRVMGARSKNDSTYMAAFCEAASEPYLHSVPVKSAVMTDHKGKDPISLRLVQLKERAGWEKAVVAEVRNMPAVFDGRAQKEVFKDKTACT